MAPPKVLPQVHLHPYPLTTLVHHLLPLLPNSLPLLRRIQFQPSSLHAHCFATFSPSTPRPQPLREVEFAALWVDRTCTPETECWIFSTYELDPRHHTPHAFPRSDDNNERGKEGPGINYTLAHTPEAVKAKKNVLALLNAVASHTSSEEKNNAQNDFLIIGSLHDSLLPLLTSPTDTLPLQRVLSRTPNSTSRIDSEGTGVLAGVGQATFKYLIPAPPSPSSSEPPISLPAGYAFSTLGSQEMELCIARTDIPRSMASLSQLRNACVRFLGPGMKEEIVAWCFLGVDGSLNSLFVEEGHRGRGLARGVVGQLMKGIGEGREGMGKGGEGWLTSDVYWDNDGGKGVARGLGGKEGWVCRWVGCDLGRVREVWRKMEDVQ